MKHVSLVRFVAIVVAFAFVTVASAQTVGIGTVAFTPLNPLDVKGGAVIGNGYAGVNTAPANGLLVEGNTGIGVATTTFGLEVQNAGRFNNTLTIGDGAGIDRESFSGTSGILQLGTFTPGTPLAGDIRYSTGSGVNNTADIKMYDGVQSQWISSSSKFIYEMKGVAGTAYTNNTTAYVTINANTFTISEPGYYTVNVFLGSPIATAAAGMNLRLQNTTTATTADGPYFCQMPDPSFGDYGSPLVVTLSFQKTTTAAESFSVQWAATTAGGTTGTQSLAGSITMKIIATRIPR